MTERPSFREQLQKQWDQGKFVCVGLDADVDKLPTHLRVSSDYSMERQFIQAEFCRRIVDATADLVCAYKPNIAFFEDEADGQAALEDIVAYIHLHHSDITVIGDTKRADIGNTNKFYAKMFDRYGFDAMTTNPYFGGDTFPPFQAYKNKGLIVLCRTTNPGSKELQDMPISLVGALNRGLLALSEYEEILESGALSHREVIPVYQMVAFLAARRWNTNGQLALVVGATAPEAFAPVRTIAGDLPFLIPGIGTQGGDLEKTLKYAPDSTGQGMIINSGSSIIFASSGEDFAEVARAKTQALDSQIREGLNSA